MTNIQQKKYNGKEWIEAHGYDSYDYQARTYYPAIMRFTTPDLLGGEEGNKTLRKMIILIYD